MTEAKIIIVVMVAIIGILVAFAIGFKLFSLITGAAF